MEVKYEAQGPDGGQCQDCKFFEASSDEPSKGKCFGKEVIAQGTCNMFALR